MRAAATRLPLPCLLGLGALLLSACVVPTRRDSNISRAVPSGTSGTDAQQAECASLRADIRAARESQREAPTISTSPEIVAAAQGKEDRNIEDLQTRYEDLDCPANLDRSGKVAPLPPAPGSP